MKNAYAWLFCIMVAALWSIVSAYCWYVWVESTADDRLDTLNAQGISLLVDGVAIVIIGGAMLSWMLLWIFDRSVDKELK